MAEKLTLYYLPMSSASMRVLLTLRIKGIKFTPVMPDGQGLFDGKPLEEINPEGRVPVLRVGQQLLTQTGAIVEWLEEVYPMPRMLPEDPWDRALVRQVCWIIGADTHPLQNMGMLSDAIRRGWMVADNMMRHPFRVHFLRREFAALEKLFVASNHKHACADVLTLADVFLAPQVRNLLGAGIDVEREFPSTAKKWVALLSVDAVRDELEKHGGIIQGGGGRR